MNNDLETRLAAWRQRTVSGELSQLEPLVWARIDARRPTPAAAILGFRAALVAAMMATGIVAGSAATGAAAPDPSPFAMHSAYAPSTLLEGGK
jgi:hypothetical protein